MGILLEGITWHFLTHPLTKNGLRSFCVCWKQSASALQGQSVSGLTWELPSMLTCWSYFKAERIGKEIRNGSSRTRASNWTRPGWDGLNESLSKRAKVQAACLSEWLPWVSEFLTAQILLCRTDIYLYSCILVFEVFFLWLLLCLFRTK